MTVTIAEIQVADSATAWSDAGFTVDPDGGCRVGSVRVQLDAPGDGIAGWSLGGLPDDGSVGDIDGIATTRSDSAATAPAAQHANGVIAIDHVVVFSPDLARTVAALSVAGVEPRRERDGDLGGRSIRQIFFRFGEVIVEVVGTPAAAGPGPATLWGITYVVADIDATAAFYGANALPVKAAVQPGRRITTLRTRELGMSVRTAMISAPILDR